MNFLKSFFQIPREDRQTLLKRIGLVLNCTFKRHNADLLIHVLSTWNAIHLTSIENPYRVEISLEVYLKGNILWSVNNLKVISFPTHSKCASFLFDLIKMRRFVRVFFKFLLFYWFHWAMKYLQFYFSHEMFWRSQINKDFKSLLELYGLFTMIKKTYSQPWVIQ